MTETVTIERAPSLEGKLIGGYRLVTELRSGGMGTVYYAEHPVIGRRAAVKVLHPEVAKNPNREFILKADKNSPYGRVDEVLDALKQSKVKYIFLLSEQLTAEEL